MAAPFNKFYGKIWVGFCLNTGKHFFLEVSFQSQQKEHRLFLKTVLGIFKIVLRLRYQYVFIWQSVKNLNVFNTLTLKQIFWKTKTFFKKLEYRFLAESAKIENASFPYKSPIPEVNVRTNRMVSAKWTCHKKRNFASNYLTLLKIYFQFKSLLQRINLIYQLPKCP